MTMTYTINTPMLTDAHDAALRQAQAQGYRNVQIVFVQQVDPRCKDVQLLVSR